MLAHRSYELGLHLITSPSNSSPPLVPISTRTLTAYLHITPHHKVSDTPVESPLSKRKTSRNHKPEKKLPTYRLGRPPRLIHRNLLDAALNLDKLETPARQFDDVAQDRTYLGDFVGIAADEVEALWADGHFLGGTEEREGERDRERGLGGVGEEGSLLGVGLICWSVVRLEGKMVRWR